MDSLRFVRHGIVGLGLTLGAFALTGCGGDDGPAQVTGAVTLDGKPLGNGVISFVPTSGETASGAGSIIAGKYTAEVPPGPKRVEITGYEIVGQEPAYAGDPNSPMKDITKPIVPDKYNAKSELRTEIKSGTNENVNFELTTQ